MDKPDVGGVLILKRATELLTVKSDHFMPQAIQVEIEVPDDLARFRLPAGVQHRLQELLDKQDQGQALSLHEQREAEGLVDLAELLSLLRLRAERSPSSGR